MASSKSTLNCNHRLHLFELSNYLNVLILLTSRPCDHKGLFSRHDFLRTNCQIWQNGIRRTLLWSISNWMSYQWCLIMVFTINNPKLCQHQVIYHYKSSTLRNPKIAREYTRRDMNHPLFQVKKPPKAINPP